MVGFNRRFSPLILKAKELINDNNPPISFSYNINAGSIESTHWIQDKKVGGGRIVGEVCHFIDLLVYLANSHIKSHNAIAMTSDDNDTVSINLKFENGSIGSINYFSNGNKSYRKKTYRFIVQVKYYNSTTLKI